MHLTAVCALVCALSVASAKVLYFKPHTTNDEDVVEFDQGSADSPDIVMYDPLAGQEYRVPPRVKSDHNDPALGAVMCPDGHSECPDDHTCCRLASGQFGCCPYPDAVCCSDKLHCCRHGYKCNVSAGQCEMGHYSEVMAKLITSKNSHAKEEENKDSKDTIAAAVIKSETKSIANITCPDKHMCQQGQTCCMKGPKNFGCCHINRAICCTDKKHCCPPGYHCGPKMGLCTQNYHIIDLSTNVTVDRPSEDNVPCPDHQSQCASGQTCCLLASGHYGCCPEPNAVCCSDDKHCCPNGYKCDTGSGQCTKGDYTMDWLVKVPSSLTTLSVKCADGSECGTGQTCCLVGDDRYGCCPIPNAVCCSDDKHCCPNGYKCDTRSGKCNKGDYTMDWLVKVPSSLTTLSVKCADGSECGTGQTCCLVGDDRYGCCPIPNAVCCSDDKHCCPNGYKCDTRSGKCNKGDYTMDWLVKVPSSLTTLSVKCADGSECGTGQTCCLVGDDRYGCCPIPNAVCCSDDKHCCPNGYKCDTGSGQCNKGDYTMDWLVKVPSSLTTLSVKCADGSECGTGQTCCLVGDDRYGCCPIPNAVCCSDDKHCCPNGYKCDTRSGKCNKGDYTMDWLVKVPSSLTTLSVKCADGSECGTGQTCCLVGDDRYGCCPIPNAVCCSDDKHCCPNGYKCDTGSGQCNKGDYTMDWLVKVPSSLTTLSVKCADGSECGTGQTCCLVGDDRYGCCPIPNAVCCSDDKHCCPNGYKCDTRSGKCNKGDYTMDWLVKVPSSLTTLSVKCADGSECGTGQTCCLVGDDRYGCCPIPNAVCCSDDKHCCPNGYKCDTGSGQCNKGDYTMDWLVKVPSSLTTLSVKCADGSECGTGQTCCLVGDDRYGCCPIPNAVCCSDDKHCCPNGYKCDTRSGKCNKGDYTMDWLVKVPSSLTTLSVKCADGSECGTGQTCCLVGDDRYGCCPIPNAVCCSDDKHCCPNGYKCDTGSGQCNKGDYTMDWLVKVPSSLTTLSVKCADGSECGTGQTCCLVGDDRYGCCPIPNAVCCSDDKHCCPNGYKCDTRSGKCNKGDYTMDWLVKVPSSLTTLSVKCADGSECGTGQTCCLVGDDRYGCCPIPNAVCCSDDKHCCPNGYKCDTRSGKCNKGDYTMDWLVKVPSSLTTLSVKCADGSECGTGQTCCLVGDDRYGCCPIPNAVCCSDDKHCCPNGYKCDTGSGQCNKGDYTMDWLVKVPSSLTTLSVKCADGSECGTGQTCCLVGDDRYGCCPIPNAVCCSDDKHCCPNGYKCDTRSGKCNKGDYTMDWLVKVPSSLTTLSVKCADGSECGTGQTCCLVGDDRYGCCPIPNAVCCSDDKHCCPNGYKCDTGSGQCNKGDYTMDWLVKVPSSLTTLSVKCADGSECGTGQTCCLVGDDRYGCCPIPNAVCCSDDKHCCPNGYKCDTRSGKCNKGDYTMDWLVKVPSSLTTLSVKCADGSECGTGQTCCLVGDDRYGCCPIPNAVCCSDDKHCCPNGYKCDTRSGKCNKGDYTMDWLVKVPSSLTTLSVKCADGSECGTGQTCCLVGDDRYGCCPIPNAVCCSDKKHCCPQGHTCDTAGGKCINGNYVMDWLVKVPSLPRSVMSEVDVTADRLSEDNVPCPDHQSECASGQTCCLLASGHYGCCPRPNAVCCSDKIHCCPEGSKCDLSSETCKSGSGLITDWMEQTESRRVRVESVICPDGKSECPTGNTCCDIGGSRYGCCPIPNAVCCSDKKHCCPQGHTCDPAAGKCNNGNYVMDWLVKVPSLPTPVMSEVDVTANRLSEDNVPCPDHQSECASGQTCCLLASGHYGCCPRPNAVCCSDKIHCCPEGSKCDLSSETCKSGSGLITDWMEQTESRQVRVESVICPDGKSECPTGSTCCDIGGSRYGCCPIPNAVCCSDKKHCCPQGHTCDPAAGKCNNGNYVMDWLVKVPSLPTPVMSEVDVTANRLSEDNVPCPDHQSECASGQTCCLLASGHYGCCPRPNAVCCSDKIHCCPEGSKCDLSSETCKSGSGLITDWMEQTESRRVRVESVICPDGKSECPTGNTCCDIGGSRYGCCPIPNAVCCSDKKHCCPQGHTCDPAAGKCNNGNYVMDWLVKVPSLPTPVMSEVDVTANRLSEDNVPCPDHQSECASGQTCCLLASGHYGCCPRPNAVCCSDKIHCCPEGSKCDLSSETCKSGSGLITDWMEQTESRQVRVESVICPDGKSECPTGSTCCDIGGSRYGCCPIPNAVCCSDKKHCCPQGHTCDPAAGKCNNGNYVMDWLVKVPSLPTPVMSEVDVTANRLSEDNVPCPDHQSECASGQTCCLLASGHYGCCPRPNAVCCSDKIHCCPEGSKCDLSSETCKSGSGLITDWMEQTESRRVRVESVICPDGKSECPTGNTCCDIGGSRYGCCPIPNAVCCSDKKHCCPQGHTCDPAAGKCNNGNYVMDWLVKVPSLPTPVMSEVDVTANRLSEDNVPCPDHQSECASGQTCCLLASGHYGCCPRPNAVCCSDKIHCCPEGSKCDLSSETCKSGSGLITDWMEQTESRRVRVESVICPDGKSECPTGNTCCDIGGSRYGCCPIPNAVCCSDKKHCCPQGHTCDPAAGKCNNGNYVMDWLVKVPSLPTPVMSEVDVTANRLSEDNVPCPDHQSECASGQTCCLLASGHYGCCPRPNAVCCSDKIHCCPEGSKCDLSSETCKSGSGLITDWMEQTESRRVRGESVICPDGKSECPTGNTCCDIGGSRYGCCPIPNAVCCSDKKHCCPQGHTCDPAGRKCNNGNYVMDWLVKVPSLPTPVMSEVDVTANRLSEDNVPCPDHQSECASGQTCCLLASGHYGCCPRPNAVCCSDGIHCCPEGSKCDLSSETCKSGSGLITDWMEQTESRRVRVESVICPDGKSECPTGNTCCDIGGGRYGCCARVNAVCCDDHKHCCPENTKCNVEEGTCTTATDLMMNLLEQTKDTSKRGDTAAYIGITPLSYGMQEVSVDCPGGGSCADTNTCCKDPTGKYGCCPYPKAVCCPDGKYCCPEHYDCEPKEFMCRLPEGANWPEINTNIFLQLVSSKDKE